MVVWQTLTTCSMTLSSHRRSARVVLGQRVSRRVGVLLPHVLDVAQPVVDEADAAVEQRGAHAAAAVVADDDDVPHLQHIDGELHHREAVEVGVDDDVGDVAVDEHFAGQQADDFVGRHAAVRAADPQILGVLLLGERGEEARLPRFDFRGPCAVVGEEMIQVRHGAGC